MLRRDTDHIIQLLHRCASSRRKFVASKELPWDEVHSFALAPNEMCSNGASLLFARRIQNKGQGFALFAFALVNKTKAVAESVNRQMWDLDFAHFGKHRMVVMDIIGLGELNVVRGSALDTYFGRRFFYTNVLEPKTFGYDFV
jgi:hypothetical protein